MISLPQTGEQDPEFNLNDVGVLARQLDGTVVIERTPLEQQPRAESFLTQLDNDLAKGHSRSVTDLLGKIASRAELKALLMPYSVCMQFSRAYEDHNFALGELGGLTRDQASTLKNPQALLAELRVRLLAWQLHAAYSQCEGAIQKKKQALYTHRRRGFQLPKYQVNDDVAVDIKTNFGYGGSSYFYLRLTYRDLPIRPYSTWVEYRNANLFEQFEFWRNYEVDNASWFSALRDCRDAANLAIKDRNAFLEEYVVKELTSLIGRLNTQLAEAGGHVENHARRIFVDERTGIDADGITPRGAKIVGALKFIKAINEFQKHVDVSAFLDSIRAANRDFHKTMLRERCIITGELERLHNEIAEIDAMLSSLLRDFPVHVGIIKCLAPCVPKWTEDLEKKVATFLPRFDTVAREYIGLTGQKEKKEELVKFLLCLQPNVEEFIQEVETYFQVSGEASSVSCSSRPSLDIREHSDDSGTIMS